MFSCSDADAPEFGRDVLAAVDRVMADGEVTVARGNLRALFSARFTLVADMTPCPRGPWLECTARCCRTAYRARMTHIVAS